MAEQRKTTRVFEVRVRIEGGPSERTKHLSPHRAAYAAREASKRNDVERVLVVGFDMDSDDDAWQGNLKPVGMFVDGELVVGGEATETEGAAS